MTNFGMTFMNDNGKTSIDLCAGVASSLGPRHPAILAAIKVVCDSDFSSPADTLPADWHHRIGVPLTGYERCLLTSSANDANELGLRIARSAFGGDKYRVITLLGSNHGDTFALRSASGRTQWQGFDGPVAAGYRHVMPGDVAAVKKAIVPETAAVCLAPVDWNRGGEAFETDYLASIEALCREHDLLLMIDETLVPVGVGGTWFFHERANIKPDLVTVSAGWCGRLAGGMLLAGSAVSDRFPGFDYDRTAMLAEQRDFPLLRNVVTATARTIASEQLLNQVEETADAWATMLDEIVTGFDFVRGCVHAGLWTTIELDLPAADMARTTLAAGLRLQVTGDTTLLICPPINVTGDCLLEAIEPLRLALESVEREAAAS